MKLDQSLGLFFSLVQGEYFHSSVKAIVQQYLFFNQRFDDSCDGGGGEA